METLERERERDLCSEEKLKRVMEAFEKDSTLHSSFV